jgi:archaeosortase A (PGF-CTERM-specific)
MLGMDVRRHMPGLLSDLLGWTVVLAFAVGVVLADREGYRDLARRVVAGAWVAFGAFWLQLVPHFAFVHKSFVEGILVLLAVPACVYTARLLYRGRDSLFVLSRAVPAMGAVYLVFETIPAVSVAGVGIPSPRQVAIESVTAQTGALINLLGYHPALVVGHDGYLNTFQFVPAGQSPIEVSVVLACTGLGSMVIFLGLVAAVRAPLRRKLAALGVALPVIYVLNLLRTTFINVVFGKQYMQWFVDEVMFLFGTADPRMVSFYLSDRVVSQLLAVVALVAITGAVVRVLPEVLTPLEDALYVVTRREYDLAGALGVDGPGVRTDGGAVAAERESGPDAGDGDGDDDGGR